MLYLLFKISGVYIWTCAFLNVLTNVAACWLYWKYIISANGLWGGEQYVIAKTFDHDGNVVCRGEEPIGRRVPLKDGRSTFKSIMLIFGLFVTVSIEVIDSVTGGIS